MWLSILSLLGGLILLPFGAEGLVRGAVALARRLNVPPVVIGLTIVAAGTSMPELVTGISAALNHSPGIVLGNVIGSNTVNLSLILGLGAMLGRIPAGGKYINADLLLTLGATGLLALLAANGHIGLLDGLILLGGLVVLNLLILRRTDTGALESAAPATPHLRLSLALLLVGGGLAALAAGGELLVAGARAIALRLGASETLIGVTIVAVGTSLPELAATLAAARARQYEILLGNLLGSCQFNIAAIIGLPAVILPLEVERSILTLHLPVMALAALAAAVCIRSRRAVQRREGLALILFYGAYIWLTLLIR